MPIDYIVITAFNYKNFFFFNVLLKFCFSEIFKVTTPIPIRFPIFDTTLITASFKVK